MNDGIILVNKPQGLTSNNCVRIISKILNTKAGHIGTLDPRADGLLPILCGNCVKLSKYFVEHDKTYIVEFELGKTSETLDLESEVFVESEDKIKSLKKEITLEKIEKVLKTFMRETEQIPPIYSSIKVDGKKLYEYARQNKEVKIPSRNIYVYDIHLLQYDSENLKVKLEVHVSKGTYIRALVRDIATKLGTVGVMTSLTRTRVNDFELENAVDLANFKILSSDYRKENDYVFEDVKDEIKRKEIELYEVVKDEVIDEQQTIQILQKSLKLESLEIDTKLLKRFLNGQKLEIKESGFSDKLLVYCSGEIVGIANVKDGKFYRDYVVGKYRVI